ncbi:glutamine synthetase family protein [Gulosibacter sp. 10]|uniref:glutamine synthetase family protein n=1 Tax=Gulosibacter sp. 10 TaxID=1255570 RepID=UPI00097E9449|nr:glutamine synthetase family protein [Gulosibacter sp. 10]SJM49690.1 Glutamine synthetase type I [Gulosibacter sp. 10]
MSRQQDYVLQQISDRGIKFIRLWFTDVLGRLKSIALAPAEVEGAFAEGVGFDGSSIEGLTRRSEADMLLHPDPSTFQVLPWHADDETARMFCNITTPDGQPAAADPRQVLRRTLERAKDLGFTFYIHPEIEFYLLRSRTPGPGGLEPVDNGGYFDHVAGDVVDLFRRRSVKLLEDLDISVEFTHHEAGPGQNEIDLRYADALAMADNVVTFRTVIDEAASEQDIYATFMPKPVWKWPGSGMHTHMSLFEGETNVFHEAGAKHQLSRTGRQFIAGLLHHAREITAITCQHVNSYRRLWGGDEAPSYVCWGHNNSSALVRVPTYKPHKSRSARVEYRGIDSSANPYLAYAVLLEAGLRGIRHGYEIPDEIEGDLRDLSARERKVLGYENLPMNLDGALELLEESELVAETLGEQMFQHFLSNKHDEWLGYRSQVTEFELRRTL